MPGLPPSLPRLTITLTIAGLILTSALGWVSWRLVDRIAAEVSSPEAGPSNQKIEAGTAPFSAPADHPGAALSEDLRDRIRTARREAVKTWLLSAGVLLTGMLAGTFLLLRIRTTGSGDAFPAPSQACLGHAPPASGGGQGRQAGPHCSENPLGASRNELLQLILDNIPQHVFWKDRHSVYQGCNRNFALAAGLGDPKEIIGKSDQDLAWADREAAWYRQCDQEVMTSGVPRYHITESQMQSNGQEAWVDTNKIPLHDAAGNVVGLLGTYEEITERKQAEENLTRALADAEQARDKIDAILKSMADGLLVVDPEGRIQLMNRLAEKIAGIPPDAGLARLLEKVIPEEKLVAQIFHTLRGAKNAKPVEWKIYDPASGQDKTFLALTSRVKNRKGELTGTLTLLRDVTREREIDRMKNEFIATAAHELRTPLTTIMGFSEILMNPGEFGVGGEEQKREFVAAVHDSARHLNTIVSDLLDLSRVQSGRMIRLHPAPCDIIALVRAQVMKYRSEKDRHLYTCSLPEQPVTLLIDPAKMEQVMDNLLSNAVKFSAHGTTVEVTGEIVDETFRVTVADQGTGMTPEQAERVFDKFFRVDTSATAPEGLGLGMAIVKNIIEAHGGRIWLETELGTGTRVCFSLNMPRSGGDKTLPS